MEMAQFNGCNKRAVPLQAGLRRAIRIKPASGANNKSHCCAASSPPPLPAVCSPDRTRKFANKIGTAAPMQNSLNSGHWSGVESQAAVRLSTAAHMHAHRKVELNCQRRRRQQQKAWSCRRMQRNMMCRSCFLNGHKPAPCTTTI